jgi:hypothetical protein
MSINILLLILKGKSSKKHHGIFVICALSFLTLMWSLAQFFFIGQYSFLNNAISNQGRTDLNPNGFVFFSIGTVVTGGFLISHFLYIYNRVKPTLKPILILSILSGITGAIGFIFVGLIPGNIYKPGHSMAANIAFGGLELSAILMIPVFLKKILSGESWPTLPRFIFMYALFFLLILLALIVPEMDFLAVVWNIDPRWFTSPPWQWISFFNVVIWLILAYLYIPSEQIK